MAKGRKKTIADANCPSYGGETELKHIRTARRKMFRYLSSCGHIINAADSDEKSITLFALLQGIEIEKGADLKAWLMNLYHSGASKVIHKEDYAFYSTTQWRELRSWALDHYGRKCMKCGDDTCIDRDLHIDHIKPKAKHPELAHDRDNVQVLCWLCNRTKSDRGEMDYRPKALDDEGRDL